MKDIDYLKKYLPKEKLDEGIKKLNEGLPVQYIIGNVNFYGINLTVNENVLIPRFETEYLVEKTINYVKEHLQKPINIIDIGTGSGNIAITLKKKIDCTVDAIDISEKALKVAKENAKKNNTQIRFIKSDMLKNVKGKYNLIISNPPYISEDEKVEKIVKENEPSIALYAKDSGLKYYKIILKSAYKHLKKPGIIAFEIGMNQGKSVEMIAHEYLKNAQVKIEKDLTGKERYVFIFVKD